MKKKHLELKKKLVLHKERIGVLEAGKIKGGRPSAFASECISGPNQICPQMSELNNSQCCPMPTINPDACAPQTQNPMQCNEPYSQVCDSVACPNPTITPG